MKKKILYYVIGLLAAVGVFLLGMSYGSSVLKPIDSQVNKVDQDVQSVNVLIDDGNKITGFTTTDTTQQANALQALQQVTSENNIKLDFDASSPMGAFVKQIGDKINGQGDKYWQYWVNDSQPMVAADKYELGGGETILWTFRKSAL